MTPPGRAAWGVLAEAMARNFRARVAALRFGVLVRVIFATGGSSNPGKIPLWVLHLGNAGVFGVALLDASPVPVPIPGSVDLLILIFAANGANPFALAAVGALGSATGSWLTWAAGKKGGEAVLERRVPERVRSRVGRWSKKYGALSVFLAGLAPPPLPTRPEVLAAGAGGTRARSVFPAFMAARTIRFGLEAYLGEHFGSQVLEWWSNYESSGGVHAVLWAVVGLIACGVVWGGWKLMRERGKKRSG